jgi:hypothetical protein
MKLTSFAALASVLAAGVAAEAEGRKERLEKAAKAVQTEARAVIGEYQEAAGPFAKWAPLADRTLETNTENTPGLVTGEMRDSIATHVDGDEAQIGSNDPKLLWFELGTVGPGDHVQPPRSVLGVAAIHSEKAIVELLGHGTARTLTGGGTNKEF